MMTLILISSLVPVLAGIVCFCACDKMKKALKVAPVVASLVSVGANVALMLLNIRGNASVFEITKDITILFRVDNAGCFFALLFSAAFFLVSVYSCAYFDKDERKNRFDCFYLISLGALMLLCFSGNLLTMYISFEAVTLFSMPLVLHDKTKESVDAAVKYLLYSIGGAFLGFIGVVYFSMNLTADAFIFGGALKAECVSSPAFPVVLILMLVGFGAKCGLFPLHNWLPTAHPVAPAPASALLSGIITKSGIVAIFRIVYYTAGADAIRGTWAHTAWIILILTTILLGSFMAVVQKNLKKRLAFSSVSQISYVLLGIAMLDGDGLAGSFLQIASHAVIKICLFLVAGALIHCLEIHDVSELDGVGYRMPVTMWCYTICALGLVGVPPTSGFTAKWYLATGALNSGLGAISVVAPVVLIVSAILTAYYLLSCTISAFFPKNKENIVLSRVHEPAAMIVPMIVLAALTLAIGIFASPVCELANML